MADVKRMTDEELFGQLGQSDISGASDEELFSQLKGDPSPLRDIRLPDTPAVANTTEVPTPQQQRGPTIGAQPTMRLQSAGPASVPAGDYDQPIGPQLPPQEGNLRGLLRQHPITNFPFAMQEAAQFIGQEKQGIPHKNFLADYDTTVQRTPEQERFENMPLNEQLLSQAGYTAASLGEMATGLAGLPAAFFPPAQDPLATQEQPGVAEEMIKAITSVPGQIDYMASQFIPTPSAASNPLLRALAEATGQTPEEYYRGAVEELTRTGGADPLLSAWGASEGVTAASLRAARGGKSVARQAARGALKQPTDEFQHAMAESARPRTASMEPNLPQGQPGLPRNIVEANERMANEQLRRQSSALVNEGSINRGPSRPSPADVPRKGTTAPKSGTAKKPWEMTREEYVGSVEVSPSGGGKLAVKNPDGSYIRDKERPDAVQLFSSESAAREAAKDFHAREVEVRARNKKDVSPEVLSDYPDLAKKYGTGADVKKPLPSGKKVRDKGESLSKSKGEHLSESSLQLIRDGFSEAGLKDWTRSPIFAGHNRAKAPKEWTGASTRAKSVTPPWWKNEGYNPKEMVRIAEKAMSGKKLTARQDDLLRSAWNDFNRYEELGRHQLPVSAQSLNVGDEFRQGGIWHRVTRKDGDKVTVDGGSGETSLSGDVQVDYRIVEGSPYVNKGVSKGRTRVRVIDGSGELDPFSPARQAVKTSLDPVTKQATKKAVSAQNIADHFRKSLKVPIRTGKFSERFEGIYKGKPEVIRTKQANDLSTIAHEVGHHIENKVIGGLGNKSGLRNLPVETQKELHQLGKELYGKRQPRSGYRSEGFAEYLAHWLMTDNVAEIAPKFHKYFEKEILAKNPDLAKSLKEGRKLTRQWREQGAVARVYSNIDFHGGMKLDHLAESLKRGIMKVNTLMADDLFPLEFVEKRLRGVKSIDPTTVRPSKSPTQIARSVSQTAGAKARSAVLDGTFDAAGNKTGASLLEILEPVSKNIEEFLTYGAARRGLELEKRGITSGFVPEDLKYVVNTMKSDVFDKAFDGVKDFQNRVMQYAVDAGVLSEEGAKAMKALNSEYIPFKRVLEEGSFVGTGGKKLANLPSVTKRIKGSGLRVQNPLRSIIENTAKIYSVADKARVGRALVELAEETRGGGKFIEEIPAPKQAQRVNLGAMKKQLEDAGVDLADASMDEVLTVYSNAGRYMGKDNIVSFWVDGKRKFYQVDKSLYETLDAVNDANFPAIVRTVFGGPARAIRLGATGLNAGFGLITNPIRDAITYGLQTEFGAGFGGRLVEGAWNKTVGHKGEMNTLFKRTGTDMSQFLGTDKKSIKRAVDEVLASDAKRKAYNVVEHPIEGLKELFSITEAAPRLAEFKAAYKKGEELYGKGSEDAAIMASNAASEVTVNFRRAGKWGRLINQIIPFWNAATQGTLRFARFAKKYPKKAAIKGVTSITIPTVTLWMYNKDKEWYRESPPWLRYGFWNFEVGEHADGSPIVLRIPKPFEWGNAFANGPEIALDYWYSVDPKIATEGVAHILETTVPLGKDYLPPVVKIPIEQWTNYDFFRDRPIDPFFEVKYKFPQDRYSPYTTETAKMIGKTFGLSPRKVDHLLSSTTGGLATDIIRAGEEVAGVSRKAEGKDTPANLPVVGRLFARTETKEKRQQRLAYNRDEQEDKIKNAIREGRDGHAKKLIAEWNKRNPDARIKPYALLVKSIEDSEKRKAKKGQL